MRENIMFWSLMYSSREGCGQSNGCLAWKASCEGNTHITPSWNSSMQLAGGSWGTWNGSPEVGGGWMGWSVLLPDSGQQQHAKVVTKCIQRVWGWGREEMGDINKNVNLMLVLVFVDGWGKITEVMTVHVSISSAWILSTAITLNEQTHTEIKCNNIQ